MNSEFIQKQCSFVKNIKVCVLSICYLLGLGMAQSEPLSWENFFNSYVESERVKWKVPGASIAIVKDGRIVYAQGFGVRSLENNKPVDENTLFAIGSITKSFTATTMGIQVDQNRYQWNSKISKLLPDFKLKDEYAGNHLTPLDILSHRSGLPSHNFLWYVTDFNRRELVHKLRFLEPSFELREQFQYNPLMYNLAGYVVGQQAGDTWESFTSEHIFEPLQMARSNFSYKDMIKDKNHALPYVEKGGKAVLTDFHASQDLSSPAGGINSSAKELANWMVMNLNEGKFKGHQVISAKNLNYIHSPHMTMPSFQKAGNGPEGAVYSHAMYGLGWIVATYHDQIILEHAGAIDGFSSKMTLLPKLNAGVLVLTNNQMGGSTLSDTVSGQAISYLMGIEPFNLSDWISEQMVGEKPMEIKQKEAHYQHNENELAGFVGNYQHDGYGDIQVSQGKDGGLTFEYYRFQTGLVAVEKDVLKTVGGIVNRKLFFIKEDNQIVGVKIQWDRSVEPIYFNKIY